MRSNRPQGSRMASFCPFTSAWLTSPSTHIAIVRSASSQMRGRGVGGLRQSQRTCLTSLPRPLAQRRYWLRLERGSQRWDKTTGVNGRRRFEHFGGRWRRRHPSVATRRITNSLVQPVGLLFILLWRLKCIQAGLNISTSLSNVTKAKGKRYSVITLKA